MGNERIEKIKRKIKQRREESKKEFEELVKYDEIYRESKRRDMKKKIEDNKITKYFRQRKEERECAKMQYLLHIYFDIKGFGLSPEEIAEVNEYIKQTMVLSSSEEMKSYLKHITILSNSNGGMKAYKNDRDEVLKMMDEGKVVSKTDACMATNRVIFNDRRISYLKGDENGTLSEVEVQPFNVHAIEVNPNAEQPVVRIPYNAEMESVIDRFKDVRVNAFPKPTKKKESTLMFDVDELEKELDEKQAQEQEIFHKYFDMGGEGLSQEEIDLVNSYIKQIVALTHPSEIKNFEKHLLLMSTLNGGMEAFSEDRKQVKAKLDSGKVITKTDACIVASGVIIKNGEQTYLIEVHPKAKNPITRVNNPRFLTSFIQLFNKVKNEAFDCKTM